MPEDLVASMIRTRERVRKLETKATRYYEDPVSGVTDASWLILPAGRSWDPGLQVRIIADIVVLSGSTTSKGTSRDPSPVVLPDRYRPAETVYWEGLSGYNVLMKLRVTPEGLLLGSPVFEDSPTNLNQVLWNVYIIWPRLP